MGRHAVGLSLALLLALTWYCVNVVGGFDARALTRGRVTDSYPRAPVTILRDGRDIPHIVAASERDAFFAQGFVEGSDRLFQMDLTRRYATGTLAEVLGVRALPTDREQRYYDVRDVVGRQWKAMDPRDRAALEAFSAGVNAAMRVQPLPVEFRLLLYRPRPWTPQDCLAVSLAVSIALADSWRDVLARDDVWRRTGSRGYAQTFPLSDSRYDVTLAGTLAKPSVPQDAVARSETPTVGLRVARSIRAGSNAWAAGGARTTSGRALLANDPHLELTIPGLWYLEDLRAPGLHVAGASIPGAPGVLLGHNERIAWGATNADASSMSLFATAQVRPGNWVRERFHVRFSHDVTSAYYRVNGAFGVPNPYAGERLVLVRWAHRFERTSAVPVFLALDRALSLRQALRVLTRYRATAENFVLADSRGRVVYHMAGSIPLDPAWSRFVRPARAAGVRARDVAFAQLPAQVASRSALVVSANNKMYSNRYPYRLSATFDPPYRAYRIAQLLRARRRYDVAYFAAMQLDARSPIDQEFARLASRYLIGDGTQVDPDARSVARALQRWNGSFDPASRGATLEHLLRSRLEENAPSLYAVLESLRGRRDHEEVADDLRAAAYGATSALSPWGRAGEVRIEHPLASLHFGFLDGVTLPGDGDEYTIRLQQLGFAQSFRAVWDVGNWDAGGIAIPSGESGEPGSAHYRDLSADWIAGRLRPLPFSQSAVRAATRQKLVIVPASPE